MKKEINLEHLATSKKGGRKKTKVKPVYPAGCIIGIKHNRNMLLDDDCLIYS